MDIHSALVQAKTQLNDAGIDTAALDARLLLAHILEVTQSHLLAYPQQALTSTQLEAFLKLIKKRATHFPLAYLLGRQDFWDLILTVNESVLVPRPETELLIEKAFECLPENQPLNILDLGTGSGAIALTIAKHRPQATVLAVDKSQAALAVALENAKRLHIHNVSFRESNWFESLDPCLKFDLIISNPPYIAPKDEHLKQSIRHEPQIALVAEEQGLADLKKIAIEGQAFLKSSGILMLEHGYDQKLAVASILQTAGYRQIEQYDDLNYQPRCTVGRLQ